MFKTRKKLKTIVTAAAISGLALSGAVANGIATAEPAEAAPVPTWLSVFYSPNCTNAFRNYSTSGTNGTLTEAWINDTFIFFDGRGSAGYGQKIRNNAASIMIPARTNVTIRSVNPVKNVQYSTMYDRGPRCFNLDTYGQRNKNIQFTLKASG